MRRIARRRIAFEGTFLAFSISSACPRPLVLSLSRPPRGRPVPKYSSGSGEGIGRVSADSTPARSSMRAAFASKMGFEIWVVSQSSNARLRSASEVQGDGSGRSGGVTRVGGEARERVGGVGAPGVGRWGAERTLGATTSDCLGAAAAGGRARRRSRGCPRMPVAAGDSEAHPTRRGPEQQRARARRRVVRQRQRAHVHASRA